MVLALSTAATAGVTWTFQANKYERLMSDQRLEFSRAHVRALEVAHAETIRFQDTAKKAQAAAAVRQRALAADRDRLRVAAVSLRDQLRAASQRLPSASTATATEYAATLGELLDQCSRAYQGMAGAADGHAADVRALIESWPKK
jgi:hypothetical protein